MEVKEQLAESQQPAGEEEAGDAVEGLVKQKKSETFFELDAE